MKKYGVRLYFDTFIYQEVEAENEMDAIEKAKDIASDDCNPNELVENATLAYEAHDVWEIE